MSNVKLGVVFPADDEIKIKKMVETGKYLSVSHFIREATREKLNKENKGV